MQSLKLSLKQGQNNLEYYVSIMKLSGGSFFLKQNQQYIFLLTQGHGYILVHTSSRLYCKPKKLTSSLFAAHCTCTLVLFRPHRLYIGMTSSLGSENSSTDVSFIMVV